MHVLAAQCNLPGSNSEIHLSGIQSLGIHSRANLSFMHVGVMTTNRIHDQSSIPVSRFSGIRLVDDFVHVKLVGINCWEREAGPWE
jgi:hypothetical protein